MALRLLVADEISALVVLALDDHFYRIAHRELGLAGVVEYLLLRNETFALQADVDDHVLVRDLDDGAGDDLVLFHGGRGGSLVFGLFAVEAGKCCGKVGCVVVDVVGRSCDGGGLGLRRGRDQMVCAHRGVAYRVGDRAVSLVQGIGVGGCGRIDRGFGRHGFQFGAQGFALK